MIYLTHTSPKVENRKRHSITNIFFFTISTAGVRVGNHGPIIFRHVEMRISLRSRDKKASTQQRSPSPTPIHPISSRPKPFSSSPSDTFVAVRRFLRRTVRRLQTMASLLQTLSEHPSIVGFRWSPAQSWGSTWSFLFTAIALYIATAVAAHLILLLLVRRRPVPLGPLPAFHSLLMALISATIFAGILLSTAAEIRDTRWLWLRSRSRTTPLQWLLCFPLGTRPSGRVFFWSYVYYLSRYLHALRSYFAVLRHRRLPFFKLFNHSILIFMSFLWLEFSQSFQILAILLTSLVYAVVYGYRFWTAVGLPSACSPFVVNCQMILLACNLLCHIGVLSLHYIKGGCNGIGAWVFNSILNAAILMLFLNFYLKMHFRSGAGTAAADELGAVKDRDM